ncbi:hypothetical protein M407DRAFT_7390 [Tulasnella calospora MUT 4182]|uniref:Uncharacterized protein n=1 Tax=Tulasnella calospora MUT 4182 TaxID=1051891 RepID=A0A0C3QL07_9AGAM|nr:hypothetical protein M407DRAFT_7390 [Tulasnella calospora MUT 4182]
MAREDMLDGSSTDIYCSIQAKVKLLNSFRGQKGCAEVLKASKTRERQGNLPGGRSFFEFLLHHCSPDAPILSSGQKMSENSHQVQEEHIKEAINYFDGYSPDLIAACIQECLPEVAAALMARWEPAFAAAVRQHIDLDGWIHIVDVRTLPATALANVANSTNTNLPVEMPAAGLNRVMSKPLLPSGSLATPAGVPNSSSSPNDAQIPPLPTAPASATHSTASPQSPGLPNKCHARHSPVLKGDVAALNSSAAPLGSLLSTSDPLGSEGGQRPSSPPRLPPRGPHQRGTRSGPNRVVPTTGSLFAGTPLPQPLGVDVGIPTDARAPGIAASTSRASPQGSPPLGVVNPQSPRAHSPPTAADHSPATRAGPTAQLSLKDSVEVAVNPFSAEQRARYPRASAPRQPRSPTPMEENGEESGLESGDDYVPEDSSPEIPQADSEPESEPEGVHESEIEESNDGTDEESDRDSAEDSDGGEAGRTKKRNRHPKIKDVEVPTAWTWDKAKNDRLLREWKLEKEIDSNPTALHPVRTKWMYKARLNDLSEEDYEDKLRSEHKELMNVPPACRSAVGQMFYRRSKGDWEFRVVLTCLTWRYTKLKIKKEEAAAEGDKAAVKARTTEMTKILNEGIDGLFERFPDMHPAHEKCQIEIKLGGEAVNAYVQALRTKVSSDVGRMYSACQASGGTLAMLESKAADRKTLSILDILGKKRKDIAFHLWGGSSSGGRDECDKRIMELMLKWRRLNPSKKSREISNQSLKVVCEVRKDLFEDLPPKVQAAWEEKAKHLHLPQTDEEWSRHKQCTCFSPKFSENNPTLWQRMRSDYLKYALELHNMACIAGQEEVVEGLPVMHTPDDDHTDLPADPTPTQSKKRENGRSPISPFQPNPSAVKSRSQRISYLSKWFMDAGERIVGYRLSWETFCKNARKYVVTERMPMDPLVEGKTLEIQKPAAMEDPRFDAWWKFMVESYDGSLSEEDRFMFQVEALHRNIPAPPIPAEASIHQAAINSTKTVPMKKSAAKGAQKKSRKTKRSSTAEDDGFLDAAGLAEDVDAAMLDMALDDQPKPKGKQRAKKTPRVESPEPGTLPPEEQVPVGRVPREGSPLRRVALAAARPGGSTSDTLDASQISDSDIPLNGVAENALTPNGQRVESSGVSSDQPVVQEKSRPRPRGVLVAALDVLEHESFPNKDKDLAIRWQEELVTLTDWGRRMGVGPTSLKVLRFRGFVKKTWTSLLPTGLDAVFCILQMWAACQEGDSPLPPVSIPPTAGLTSVDPNHPIALAINLILDPQKTLPTVKILNVQFGASPEANDAFFDFMEGSLTALVQRAVQSEDVFLDGSIDVMQILRLATFLSVDVISSIAKLCPDYYQMLSNAWFRHLGLRPWWMHGELGLPSAVGFTTKQSLASSCLYDTLALLDWSSLSLLERSQYLLLVFLVGIQVHNGRVPSEPTTLDNPQVQAKGSSPKTIEKVIKYLRSLKEVVSASTENGDVDPPLENRLLLPNVRRAIIRWESESRSPGVIQSSLSKWRRAQGRRDGGKRRRALPSLGAVAHSSENKGLEKDEPAAGSGAIPGGSSPGGEELNADASQHDQHTPGYGAPPPFYDGSTSSSVSKVPFEEEDKIWPDGEGPAAVGKPQPQPSEPNPSPPVGPSPPAPEIPEPVIPAIRPRAQSPAPAGKAKRRRIIPETPPQWQTEHHDSERRQLRSNRLPQPQVSATAAGSTATSHHKKKLQVIDETQARVAAASSRRQPSRTKRPPA